VSLILPNLDDKSFSQIADEARLLIPSTAPEWTDHNVHDPGITFTELFAWLAEIAHYRVNQTSAASYERFFSLMGVAQHPPQAAEVSVAFEFNPLAQGLLIPRNSNLIAVGLEPYQFATVRDQFLTRARVKRVVTHAGERKIVQTTAEQNEIGHYEAFGPLPAVGDSIVVEFDDWFDQPQGQFQITLYEDDLTFREPLSEKAVGFEPSATVRWQYRSDSQGGPSEWTDLDVVHDETLCLSRSGDLIFKTPTNNAAANHKQLRAILTKGYFEIPPRITSIRTNNVRARQVETVVNEGPTQGLGTADQTVRLKKAPPFINPVVDEGAFQVGDVLDWKAFISRLREAEQRYGSPMREMVLYLVRRLQSLPNATINLSEPDPSDLLKQQEYALAQAFDQLLSDQDFYQPSVFGSLSIPVELTESNRCRKEGTTRRLNRFLLQLLFPDLILSDRVEVQVGVPAPNVEDEINSWQTWQRVDDFLSSGPDDNHYVLDPVVGLILFGNGLNGRIPQTTQFIRIRFYRYSQLEKGNVTAGHHWTLDRVPPNTPITKRVNAATATGGRRKETLEETKLRAREVFRKETAILTAKDYETLAQDTPGLRIARVKVLPNFNPKLCTITLPGEVTIIVEAQPAPRAAFPDALPTPPSEGFLNTIRNSLDSRRVVTTNLHVIGPNYVEVGVSCRVYLKKRVAESTARVTIERAIREFLDPVFGGPTGDGWPFGRSIFPSEISQQLTRVSGVDFVTNVGVNGQLAGVPFGLPYNGLPTSGAHHLMIVAFENRDQESTSRMESNCG
jgi:hypothetical protein